MTSLERLLTDIGPLLLGQASLADTQRLLYADAQSPSRARLAIYERFCRTHRDSALAHVFLHCRRVLKDAWPDTVERYFRAHPMLHVELNKNGEHFPDFLRGATPAFLGELADFEWWEWLTRAPAQVGEPPLPASEKIRTGLRIAASVEVRPYHFDFVDWIDAQSTRDAPAAPPASRATLVVFWRTREEAPRRDNLSADELSVLRQVDGAGVVDAALASVVEDLLGAGILAQ